MSECESAFEKHLRKIAKRAFVAQPPQDDKPDDIGGILEAVEGRASPLVERRLTGRAVERVIAKLSFLGALTRCGGGTMSTAHYLLRDQNDSGQA